MVVTWKTLKRAERLAKLAKPRLHKAWCLHEINQLKSQYESTVLVSRLRWSSQPVPIGVVRAYEKKVSPRLAYARETKLSLDIPDILLPFFTE